MAQSVSRGGSAAFTTGPDSLAGTLGGLSEAEFDGLPFGAILVDDAGTVLRYNATESRLSGRTRAEVLGRNFFRDIAPCTHVPGFHGRFADGVARGRLDCRFTFVFEFRMDPVRVEIRMMSAEVPGRHWILVRKLGNVRPRRVKHGSAGRMALTSCQVADHSLCERERLQFAGAVQPHGALLAFCPRRQLLVAMSANAPRLLGRPIDLGMPLQRLMPQSLIDRMLAGLSVHRGFPPHWETVLTDAEPLQVAAHLTHEHLILEVEPVVEPGPDGEAIVQLETALSRLRATEDMAALGQIVATALQSLTGFDRALVYRFDSDWHGEVIAEAKVPDWDQSFVGLHFPATDIPAQARDLYTRSLSRHVPHRDYVPVPIQREPDTAEVDLSLSRYRSLSPFHLEYHRNMGVDGSMSLSIMADGRLWGLAVCHHRTPHHVTLWKRSAAMALVEALAMRVLCAERAAAMRGRSADIATLKALTAQMADTETVLSALTTGPFLLSDLFQATGAAIVRDGAMATLGAVPAAAVLEPLCAWLADRWDETGTYQSSCLATAFAPAKQSEDVASGLFAVRLGADGCLLWFRPEKPRIVCWGGDPSRSRVAGDGMPMPRASFARWTEALRGRAEPWPAWTTEVSLLLRHEISEVMLRHLDHSRQLGRELAASNLAKTQFLGNMSHELRTPLNAVIGFSELMLSGIGGPLAGRQREYTESINAAGQHLLDLVDRILDLTRLETATLTLKPGRVDPDRTAAACLNLVSARAELKGVKLVLAAGGAPPIVADGLRLRQVLLNLLGNAVKFTPRGGTVTLTVQARGTMTVFTVADTGRGMTAAGIEEALRPFRRRSEATRDEDEGAGLGLPIARTLVDLHGGRLRIRSAPGAGTTVTVELPPTPPAHAIAQEPD